ncbi:hypothetical protein [Corallococcus exiguus]|uniref:hypothetical protein n=1 Tax=Corallococcus exiguus TaxID=83462 RepID=UPI0030B83F02
MTLDALVNQFAENIAAQTDAIFSLEPTLTIVTAISTSERSKSFVPRAMQGVMPW